MLLARFDHDADCSRMSAQVQNEIDALTELDQVLYTAARVEYEKVTGRENVPIDFACQH